LKNRTAEAWTTALVSFPCTTALDNGRLGSALDIPRSKLKIQPASETYREINIICLVAFWEDGELVWAETAFSTEYSLVSVVGAMSVLTSVIRAM
jgi:hypothetical protein